MCDPNFIIPPRPGYISEESYCNKNLRQLPPVFNPALVMAYKNISDGIPIAIVNLPDGKFRKKKFQWSIHVSESACRVFISVTSVLQLH